MSATCAACLKPIANGQPFVLSGTEVFHRTSSCIAGIAKSALTRIRIENARLRDDTKRLEAEALSLRRDAAEERINAQNFQADVAVLKAKLERTDTLVRNEERATQFAEARATAAQRELGRIGDLRRQLENELAAARAEIARLQAEALRRATDDLPAPERDARDPTEIRFSLLELDKS